MSVDDRIIVDRPDPLQRHLGRGGRVYHSVSQAILYGFGQYPEKVGIVIDDEKSAGHLKSLLEAKGQCAAKGYRVGDRSVTWVVNAQRQSAWSHLAATPDSRRLSGHT